MQDFLHLWAEIAQHQKNIDHKQKIALELIKKNNLEFLVMQKKMDKLLKMYGLPEEVK